MLSIFLLRFLITIMLSIFLFTLSHYHYIVHTSIYGFWLSLCCPYFYLRFLITIMLSIFLFTVSDYHYVVHTSIYGFSLPLCCPYFYLRLITIMLSIFLFTSDYHYLVHHYYLLCLTPYSLQYYKKKSSSMEKCLKLRYVKLYLMSEKFEDTKRVIRRK
jgi:hypothetical protein